MKRRWHVGHGEIGRQGVHPAVAESSNLLRGEGSGFAAVILSSVLEPNLRRAGQYTAYIASKRVNWTPEESLAKISLEARPRMSCRV